MPTKIGAEKVMAVLMNDEPASKAKLDDDEEKPSSLGTLTRKKMIYAANVSTRIWRLGTPWWTSSGVAEKEGAKLVIVSQVESELVDLSPEDRGDFLESLGVTLEGTARVVGDSHDLLGLQT
jgi:ribosome-binding ATPase YchF (GTP1/OBG family)